MNRKNGLVPPLPPTPSEKYSPSQVFKRGHPAPEGWKEISSLRSNEIINSKFDWSEFFISVAEPWLGESVLYCLMFNVILYMQRIFIFTKGMGSFVQGCIFSRINDFLMSGRKLKNETHERTINCMYFPHFSIQTLPRFFKQGKNLASKCSN